MRWGGNLAEMVEQPGDGASKRPGDLADRRHGIRNSFKRRCGGNREMVGNPAPEQSHAGQGIIGALDLCRVRF